VFLSSTERSLRSRRCTGSCLLAVHDPAPLDTGPDDTHPAGASDRHGPSTAAWNVGEAGLTPLSGPSWLPFLSGLGNFGTPCARMHSAKARVKVVAERLPVDWLLDVEPGQVTTPVPVFDVPRSLVGVVVCGALVPDDPAAVVVLDEALGEPPQAVARRPAARSAPLRPRRRFLGF